MSIETSSALFTEQDFMVSEILEEIIEHTGKPYSFAFTENILLVNARVWHEIKMMDGTEEILYAHRDNDGKLFVVNDRDDIRNF